MNVESLPITQNTTALPALFNNDIQDAGRVPSRKTAAGQRPQHRLPNSNTTPCLTSSPHPILSINTNGTENAEQLKQLLLNLADDPQFAIHRKTLRSAADSVRIEAFGYNRATTKKKILKLLQEFHCLELEDLTDETGIAETEIREALLELVNEHKIEHGRRRRWQEPGKHYNAIFVLTV
jgi:hypothetical protein